MFCCVIFPETSSWWVFQKSLGKFLLRFDTKFHSRVEFPQNFPSSSSGPASILPRVHSKPLKRSGLLAKIFSEISSGISFGQLPGVFPIILPGLSPEILPKFKKGILLENSSGISLGASSEFSQVIFWQLLDELLCKFLQKFH